jgi:hypothetical protein
MTDFVTIVPPKPSHLSFLFSSDFPTKIQNAVRAAQTLHVQRASFKSHVRLPLFVNYKIKIHIDLEKHGDEDLVLIKFMTLYDSVSFANSIKI